MDYPELQLEFIIYLSSDPELVSSVDEEYAPNIRAWSRIASNINEIAGACVFEGWQSARRMAVSICGPRYQLAARGKLPAPSSELEEAIDQWNSALGRRRQDSALRAAASGLWPKPQEKAQGTARKAFEDEALDQLGDISWVPRTLAQQKRLLSQLKQRCHDGGRANKKFTRPVTREQTARIATTHSTFPQRTTSIRKRKTKGHEEGNARGRRIRGGVRDGVVGYEDTRKAGELALPSLKRRKGQREISAAISLTGTTTAGLGYSREAQPLLKAFKDRLR